VTLALRELVRARSRFVAVGAALTLIAVLVLLLGGLLDGLLRGATGLLRTQDGELVVYADDARQTLERSVLTPDETATVAAVDGVAGVTGFGAAVVSASRPGDGAQEPIGVAIVGYAAPTGPVGAPTDAGATADARIADAGVDVGDRLVLPGGAELTVVDTVRDVAYAGQPTLWVPVATYRELLAAARPDSPLGEDGINALSVRLAEGADPAAVARAIDEATGSTETLTVADAIAAIPGVAEQDGTFTAIIGATLVVAGLVVALFFALLTLERAPLYAVLKALGATTRELATTVTLQATIVALSAAVLGGLLTVGLAAVVPDGVPVELRWPRALLAVTGLVVTAVVGSAASLRRLTRIDPAEAIG
jgi:putative ABC transport system permease protein